MDPQQWIQQLRGGAKPKEQNPYDAMNNWMTQMAKMLSDPSSPYYQKFRQYLGSVTPTMGTNALLAPMLAGGGDYGASTASATELQKNFERGRQDFLNKGVGGMFQQSQNLLPQILQLKHQALTTPRQMDIERQRIEAGSGGIFDFLGGPMGALFGNFGGMFGGGGAASAAPMLPAMASDVRLKENIHYTDEITKDGIPVAEFNFKGYQGRFRGVIAQDVEKKRPDAVVEISGYKHVYYDMLR